MHDNSRVLRAVLVNTFLQRARITRMERPACSPDMDKIEHVWELILDVDNDHILHATYAESPLKSGPGLAWSSYRWYATTDSRPHPSKGTFQHVFMRAGFGRRQRSHTPRDLRRIAVKEWARAGLIILSMVCHDGFKTASEQGDIPTRVYVAQENCENPPHGKHDFVVTLFFCYLDTL